MKSENLLRHINHFPFPVENRNRGYPIRKHDEDNLDYIDAYFKNEYTDLRDCLEHNEELNTIHL